MTVALAVVGGIVGAIGALAQADAQSKAAQYNAQVAERNATAARAQAVSEGIDTVANNRRKLSSIRAAIGASGVDIAGSPLDVIGDSAIEGSLDVARVKYKGEVRAAGYDANAQLSRMEASSAKTAGYFNAAGKLLGGFQEAGTSLARAA